MKLLTRQNGFSLLELITVVVILGVLAAGGGLLITRPIEAYDDMVRRQQLVDQGEMALRQIARDVRRALPNSVRVDGTGLAVEMFNTVDGARYRDENQTLIGGPADILDFTTADSSFNLLGTLNNPATFSGSYRLAIYNTVANTLYADAAANGVSGVITPDTSTVAFAVSPNYPAEHQITISAPFQFSQESPGQRVFLVDAPISYVCDIGNSRIVRYRGYTISAGQLVPPPLDGTTDTVISQLSSCNMAYAVGTAQRGGVLTIQIGIDDSGETINLLHQIHVVNVP
ncbi:MAG: type II secretion system protein [Pseudomonadota bacterium]